MHTAHRGQQMNHLPRLFIVSDSNNITFAINFHHIFPSEIGSSRITTTPHRSNMVQSLPCHTLYSLFYSSIESITDAIKNEIGFTPGIKCNMDSEHNSWLYQVYMCINTSGLNLI
ncbi:hypothetical protein Ahy_B05g074290 [Arachis hypogaea]|uniref:Uncharacterized protein n=1 Tax=Arachis hypogaea TaxID=3818 RepID=A0A444YYH0_ARAHY|nr:hypothetical protein Ahy_B05g074290 [Arachis hypogaea]